MLGHISMFKLVMLNNILVSLFAQCQTLKSESCEEWHTNKNELLWDSTEEAGAALSNPINVSALRAS
jgi:hypothetical protein